MQDLLDGAIAINTGRPIAEIDQFLAPLRLAAAGIHGAEIRFAPDALVQTTAPLMDESILAATRELELAASGIMVEPKTCSVAVHYRNAPELRPLIERALEDILASGPDHLILSHGRKVIEIVPKGVSKGAALAALMRTPPFAGRRPVMIGDDLSDETAFAMAEQLGGTGARVAGELFELTHADFAGPAHVRAWLAQFVSQHRGD